MTYNKEFLDQDCPPLNDYTQAVSSLEFSQFKMRAENDEPEGSDCASLMASSHVDGSVKIYKFNSFDELNSKYRDCRPDVAFKDHFYSANQVTFAKNTKSIDGSDLPSPYVGGH